MSDAVIVSTARTGLAKSYRGSLNNTHSVDRQVTLSSMLLSAQVLIRLLLRM